MQSLIDTSEADRLLTVSNSVYQAIEEIKAAEGDKSVQIASVYDIIGSQCCEPEDIAFYEAAIKEAAGRGYANLIRDCAKKAKKLVTARKRDNANRHSNYTALSQLPDGITEPLMCGRYTVTDLGIQAPDSTDSDAVMYTLTTVPIIPVLIMTNQLTGMISIRLAYLITGEWQTITTDMRTVSNRHDIVNLSAYGLGVTSENAAGIVSYINTITALNQARIPTAASTSQLGWSSTNQFVPYTSSVVYDGADDELRRVFDAVATGGSESEWFDMMRTLRADTTSPIRVYIAAALAAPILERLGKLCSFVHLWGTSQFGKTVSLLVAASIYGNPAEGHLMHSLSSTQVGMTLLAGTLKNLPLCLDESESIKDKAGNLQNLVYTLTQGMSKTKGTKGGGMAQSARWRTLILTNGESPLTDADSAGGAVNRVLNVYCDQPLFADPAAVADCVRQNYGWGGEKWIRFLSEADDLKARFDQCAGRLKSLSKATGKQLDIGAVLLLADELATQVLFHDQPMDIGVLTHCMVSMDDINVSRRALEMVRDWLAANQASILPAVNHGLSEEADGVKQPRIIGKWLAADGSSVAIIPQELKRELTAHGFSYDAFLAGMDQDGRIIGKDTDVESRKTKKTRIGSQSIRCLQLRLTDMPHSSEYVQCGFEL